MEIIRTYRDLPGAVKNTVTVIGNFDGVHKGHSTLLSEGRALAEKHNVPLSVLTFEPHPKKLFRPDDPPFRITPSALKADRLAREGVAVMFEINFDWDFASQSAELFVDEVLKEGLACRHVVVGYDFRFGQLRKGTPDLIRQKGFELTVIEEVADEGAAKYSSSNIRQALRHGDINRANRILGWEWEIGGAVVKGDQRGRALGYPTANFLLGDIVHPAYGVYAARVQIEGEEQWHGAAVNIGIRPMFEVPQAQVEAYIFDFDKEIYGRTIRVKPVQHLRGEAKFKKVEELISQMGEDCRQARQILGL